MCRNKCRILICARRRPNPLHSNAKSKCHGPTKKNWFYNAAQYIMYIGIYVQHSIKKNAYWQTHKSLNENYVNLILNIYIYRQSIKTILLSCRETRTEPLHTKPLHTMCIIVYFLLLHSIVLKSNYAANFPNYTWCIVQKKNLLKCIILKQSGHIIYVAQSIFVCKFSLALQMWAIHKSCQVLLLILPLLFRNNFHFLCIILSEAKATGQSALCEITYIPEEAQQHATHQTEFE